MFVGHLAVAFAVKPAAPRVSLGRLIAAAFALDLLWPILLLLGLERVRVEPGATAFTPLAFDSYPWSHSLLAALGWGILIGRLLAGRARRAMTIVAAVVVSHWVLDFVTHRPDLPLFPGGPQAGLGLWNSIAGTVLVEGALLAAALAVYLRSTRARKPAGTWSLWALVVFCAAIWISGPFSPPPPGATAIAIVGLAMWLFPLWGAWIDRNREARTVYD